MFGGLIGNSEFCISDIKAYVQSVICGTKGNFFPSNISNEDGRVKSKGE